MPVSNVSWDRQLSDERSNIFAYCFDWFGEFRRLGKRAQKFLFTPLLIPVIAAASYNNLVIHTGRTFRKWRLKRTLPYFPLCPVTAVRCRNRCSRSGLLQGYIRNAEPNREVLHRFGPNE